MDIKWISLKTAFAWLLALTTVRQVRELNALLVTCGVCVGDQSCECLTVPKPGDENEPRLGVCPVRALKHYVEMIAS